ncbi:MAG: hypothetical protein ABI599_05425 [Flavobacteriales bacterium]
MGNIRSIIVLCSLLLLGGCYYDSEEVLYPGSFCDTANVTYSGTVQSLIQTNCAVSGCHVPGGQGTGNFQVFAELKARVDNGTFRTLVLVNRTMPPNNVQLSACELEQLTIWVNAGALEN